MYWFSFAISWLNIYDYDGYRYANNEWNRNNKIIREINYY